jgi:Acetoacetate decarboxylase (ADC)
MNAPTPTEKLAATSAGEVKLPVEYRDGSMFGSFYRVDPQTAADLIPTAILEPIRFGDKAIAGILAFEYRDTSIGAYGEFGVAILARRCKTKDSALGAIALPDSSINSGWYVVNLPVTTELARAGGIDIWGFPKYIRPIATGFSKSGIRITLDGELDIHHKDGFGFRLPARPMALFTILNDTVLRTVVRGRYGIKYGGTSSTQVNILGDGLTANTVRKLRLDSMLPLISFRADHLNMLLPEGTPFGTASSVK